MLQDSMNSWHFLHPAGCESIFPAKSCWDGWRSGSQLARGQVNMVDLFNFWSTGCAMMCGWALSQRRIDSFLLISSSCRHCSFLVSPQTWNDVLLFLFCYFCFIFNIRQQHSNLRSMLECGILMLRTALSSLSWKYSFVLFKAKKRSSLTLW